LGLTINERTRFGSRFGGAMCIADGADDGNGQWICRYAVARPTLVPIDGWFLVAARQHHVGC
jgi:hypothetical protein